MKTHLEARIQTHAHAHIHSLSLSKSQARAEFPSNRLRVVFRGRREDIEAGLRINGKMFHIKFIRDGQRENNTIRSKGVCKQGQ